ncbi:hypothetical protein [Marinobacterium mangrovicola]|uniref:Uncharacterized protein n=1 Tax=Marinobacterium mangrovicola TaxID=1476959 RepID=A0A4R1H7P1_9GAMM|nr:hypothetical protein [Marinobacterium mangrovicola]TCK16393.1 hypothetical protein CLV83_0167 [Marinobacterium mangrovicola]
MGAIFQLPEDREESQNGEVGHCRQVKEPAGASNSASVLSHRSEDMELTAAKEVETWLSTWGTEI